MMLVVIFLHLIVLVVPGSTLTRNKLLIILIDGLRWDAFSNNRTQFPGYQIFQKFGSVAQFNKPVFPADSFPNYEALATGLYPESNGIVANLMYDPKYKMRFYMGSNDSFWWEDAEPIWIQAEKAGYRTALYNWPYGEVPIHGHRPTYCKPLNNTFDSVKMLYLNMRKTVRKILLNFIVDKFKLQLLYYGRLDIIGHSYGQAKGEYDLEVWKVDNLLNYLLKYIRKQGLDKDLNVYVVSDHGVLYNISFVNLYNVVNKRDIEVVTGSGSSLMIEPKGKKAEERIYQSLKQCCSKYLHVYKKHEIPEVFHIRNHSRTLGLFLRSKPGHYMLLRNGTSFVDEERFPGSHGFWVEESPDMRGVMMAIGPNFKKGFQNSVVEQVDHYQLFTKILGISAKPHNGSWARVSSMFIQ